MKNGHQRDIQALHPSCWDVDFVEVKYCDDTRPEQQLARATEQHIRLKYALAQQCHKVSLKTIRALEKSSCSQDLGLEQGAACHPPDPH